jgi:hypothetical protein
MKTTYTLYTMKRQAAALKAAKDGVTTTFAGEKTNSIFSLRKLCELAGVSYHRTRPHAFILSDGEMAMLAKVALQELEREFGEECLFEAQELAYDDKLAKQGVQLSE